MPIDTEQYAGIIRHLKTCKQINDTSARWRDPYEGLNYYIQLQLNSKANRLPNIRIIRKDEARRILVLFENDSFKVTPHRDKKFTYYVRCKKEEVEK